MTRKTAITAIFAAICSRAYPQNPGGSVALYDPNPKDITYRFSVERLHIQIDGRKVALTAKEIADALGAK